MGILWRSDLLARVSTRIINEVRSVSRATYNISFKPAATIEWEWIMKEIKTEIIIDSKPEKVWEVLTDFENYPTWNPFIQNISGEQKVG